MDGIQVEVGDYAVCHYPKCQERRKNEKVQQYFSVLDMISTYTVAMDVSLAAKSDAWVICETYSSIASNRNDSQVGWNCMDFSDRKLLETLPEKAILQWAVNFVWEMVKNA